MSFRRQRSQRGLESIRRLGDIFFAGRGLYRISRDGANWVGVDGILNATSMAMRGRPDRHG